MNTKKIKEEMEEIINLPELCYQSDSNKFWMKDSRGYFVSYHKGAIATRLEYEYEMNARDTGHLFAKTYKENVVDMVTPIGGLAIGIHDIGGNKVLVPREQRRIEPVKGEWGCIKQYMTGMLGAEQVEWYKG